MTQHEYYTRLAEYWFEQRDYEQCAYYRIRASKVLNDAVRARFRREHNIPQTPFKSNQQTFILD